MNGYIKAITSTLQKGESYIWNYRDCDVLIARSEGSPDTLVATPLRPREYRELPREKQKIIEDWLNTFTTFSPATIGWAFKWDKEVKFDVHGKRFEVCSRCQRLTDPEWSDCSCGE